MLLKSFLAYAMLTCCVLSVVIGGLLWSRKQAGRHANRLLAVLLFVYAYVYFVTVLITDGGIVYVPHLFRTAAPLNYLIGPLIFLYVRASLLSATRPDFRRYAWLFLPALLNVIEFIPFYAQSGAYKLERLKSLASAQNSLFTINEGLLPPQFHLIGYSLSSLIYSLLAARLWWIYRRREGQNQHSNPVFANWLTTFVLVHVSVNLVWVIEMPFIRNAGFGNLTMNVTYTIAQLTICLYIIRRPALLYGAYTLSRPDGPTGGPSTTPAEPPMLIPANRSAIQGQLVAPADPADLEQDIQQRLGQLEQYMASQQPYLQPRLSLADVSVATKIPPYLLSAMLNRVVGLDFRDYVNAHRVRHLCQLLEGNQYAHLTLEGISTQAGFSSKTTFYRAFQKHTGVTPAQYLLNSDPSNN